MEETYLQKANLKGANLQGANLKGARLVEAHLEGTNLKDAHLEGANLENAVGLTREQIDSAHIDEKTKYNL